MAQVRYRLLRPDAKSADPLATSPKSKPHRDQAL
jgi:hypothetical protein